jgi:uncharacterized protein YdeI (YjbR/CyaY-like superfamily)
MTALEFDPRDVLEKYVTLLNKPEDSVIRDVAELAHPKDAIKSVLQHCIRTAADGETQAFLRNSYIALANFQQMSDDEREAAKLLKEVGAPAPEGSKLFNQQARRITHVAQPLQSVLDRLKAEIAVLTQDLKSLPGAD